MTHNSIAKIFAEIYPLVDKTLSHPLNDLLFSRASG